MRKAFELLWALIHAQDQYIGVLGRDIDAHASFLHVHGIQSSSEVVAEGVRLREVIEKLKKEIEADPTMWVDELKLKPILYPNKDVLLPKIEEMIRQQFPFLNIQGILEDDHLLIAVDSTTYHSQEYLELVTKINMEYLWPNKIHNVLFVSKD